MKKILGLALLASLLVVSLAVAWNPPGGWDSWRQAMTTFGFSATDASKTTMNKGLLMPAGSYIDWGSTYGTTGYGIRDNSGTLQMKNSGGAWANIGSGAGSGASAIINYLPDAVSDGGHQISNNVLYSAGGTGQYRWNGTNYDTLTAWQTASGQTGNLSGDPLFLNLSTRDFHLISSSPGVDAGVDVGVTVDYAGDPRPRKSAYDIGAYEYFFFPAGISNTTLGTGPALQIGTGVGFKVE